MTTSGKNNLLTDLVVVLWGAVFVIAPIALIVWIVKFTLQTLGLV